MPHSTNFDLSMCDERDFEGAPRRLAAYRRALDVARIGSLVATGDSVTSGLTCSVKAERRACGAFLDVMGAGDDAPIVAQCPECGASERVHGWSDTRGDLRGTLLGPAPGVPRITVTAAAYRSLLGAAREDRDLFALAYTAVGGARGKVRLVHLGDPEVSAALSERIRAGRSDPDGRRLGAIFMALIGRDLQPGPEGGPVRAKRAPARQEPARTLRIKVTLRDLRPPIWRRLLVHSNLTLEELHRVIQAAMGWRDEHLYGFWQGRRRWRPAMNCESGPFETPANEERVGAVLVAPKDRLVYDYDPGDGWSHDVLLEEVTEGFEGPVRCIKGRRACPPENCGGVWGYEELCEAAAGRGDEEARERLAWVGGDLDPEHFDLDEVNARLRRV